MQSPDGRGFGRARQHREPLDRHGLRHGIERVAHRVLHAEARRHPRCGAADVFAAVRIERVLLFAERAAAIRLEKQRP